MTWIIRFLLTYRRFFVAVIKPFVPFIVSYDQGWIDGWNSHHCTPPSEREFMTREKLEKRYKTTVPDAEPLFNREDN